MAAPGFWDDQESAQKTTGELSALNAALKPLQALSASGDDLEVLVEFAEEDPDVVSDIEIHIAALRQNLEQVELKAMMGELIRRKPLVGGHRRDPEPPTLVAKVCQAAGKGELWLGP